MKSLNNLIHFNTLFQSDKFKMLNLYTTLIGPNSGYEISKDYKYFICNNLCNSQKGSNIKNKICKELYLTYTGIVRLLCISRSPNIEKFQKWAFEKLFTIQFGTTEQKNKLVSHIKGVSYETIQELFSVNARSLPCVYLTAFNTVGVLRNVMNIDNKYSDDAVVYKFGLTKSFESRKNGHKSEYKKLENFIDMKLIYFTYIDILYLTDAELEIKNLLRNFCRKSFNNIFSSFSNIFLTA